MLALAVGLLLAVGPAQAMGKKAPVEKEKELGQGGTMTKSYDPETGVKKMEKEIGSGGEKTMTLEKESQSGATVERSWSTGGEKESPGQAKGKNK